MARCECPFERTLGGNERESFPSSRQVVLRQLRSASCKTRKRARQLRRYCAKRARRGFVIVKPERSCQGAGIQILPATGDLCRLANVVCQRYIEKPLLMDGRKFDVRLYALVTSVCPLRLYLYEEGLLRLATVPYQPPSASNLQEKKMHLTNYAINRGSGGDSCKRSLTELESLLLGRGLDPVSLWRSVERLLVLSVLSGLPSLQRLFAASFPGLPACSPCFELLGFDVLLDSHARPYLLEVNRSPSLGGSTELDRATKRAMVRNALEMVLPSRRQVALLDSEQHLKARRRLHNLNLKPQPTARERVVAESALEQERSRAGRFRALFPAPDDRYDRFLVPIQQ